MTADCEPAVAFTEWEYASQGIMVGVTSAHSAAQLDPLPRSAARRLAEAQLLRGGRSSLIFVVIVWVMTSFQVIAMPATAILGGPVEWPFTLPPLVIFALAALGCAAQAASLLLSSRWPATALLATVLGYLVLLVGLNAPNWLHGMYLVIALAQFILASEMSAGRATLGFLGAVALGMGGLFVWGVFYVDDLNTAAGFVAGELARFAAPALGATALGMWWRAQVTAVVSAREQAELAQQEHDARVADARNRERGRIAQELHDVAGQHLAGLVTLSDAAVTLAPQRPSEALRLVEEVRNEGRFAAASLAGALSDLHAGTPGSPEVTRDLRRSEDLVSYWTERGMVISFRTSPALSDLPAVVSTTAYRALQEALTNVAKHAPGSEVAVDVRVIPDGLRVNVTNGPAQRRPGTVPGLDLHWGLTGMRERVELLRGTLIAGPTPAGGWEVRIRIPIEVV